MQLEVRQCIICNGNYAQALFSPPHSPGPIVRCQECGLVYVSSLRDVRSLIQVGPRLGNLDPRVLTSSNLQDVAGCWEFSLLPSKLGEWPAIRLNAAGALERIERVVPSRGRLLDFGCGWGFFLAAAKERGWKIYGLEPLPGHAVYARAQAGAAVVTDTLHDDSFPADYFDAITAFQVFEHLPDPAGDLARLRRMLKPGGAILIEVPNIDTWSVQLLGPRHRHFVGDHLTFFSARTLRMLLEKAGFEVLATYHPTRRMTVRHLLKDWGPRYLPGRFVAAMEAVARRLGQLEQIVALNLGDIVTVIGRKAC